MPEISYLSEALKYCTKDNFERARAQPLHLGEDQSGRSYWLRSDLDLEWGKWGFLVVTTKKGKSWLELPFSINIHGKESKRRFRSALTIAILAACMACPYINFYLCYDSLSRKLNVIDFFFLSYVLTVIIIGKKAQVHLPETVKSKRLKSIPLFSPDGSLLDEFGYKFLLNDFWRRVWSVVGWCREFLFAALLVYIELRSSRGSRLVIMSAAICGILIIPDLVLVYLAWRVRSKLQSCCSKDLRVGFIGGPKRWSDKHSAIPICSLSNEEKEAVSEELRKFRFGFL